MQIRAIDIRSGINKARFHLLKYGNVVETNSWQGVKCPPMFLEILNLNLMMPMTDGLDSLKKETNPFLPWAEDHFQERIAGEPVNPPPSHKIWLKGNEDFLTDNKFSHSYPERLWPKTLMPNGIRFNTADLSDAITLLKKDPTTRQCYIPIFFPEDLNAAIEGERVPCTLGWQFIVRNEKMHCFYPMRSCDAIRHFHNDIFFANRMTLFLIEAAGINATPGTLNFSCTSFHCFENDKYTLKKLTGEN